MAEILLYALTSRSPGVPSDRSPCSMPSATALACRALGLSCSIYLPPRAAAGPLACAYPHELAQVHADGVPVVNLKAHRPVEGQRLIRVVSLSSAGLPASGLTLHYLMERPDGSVMDPSLGWDHSSLQRLIAYRQCIAGICYKDTEIAMMIDKA